MVKLARRLGRVSWALDCPGLKSRPYRDTRGPGAEAVGRMLRATADPRDRAILRLLFDLGLRRGEVVALDLADVDLEVPVDSLAGAWRASWQRPPAESTPGLPRTGSGTPPSTLALDLTRGDVRAARRFSRYRNVQTLTSYDDNRTDLGGSIAAQVAAAV